MGKLHINFTDVDVVQSPLGPLARPWGLPPSQPRGLGAGSRGQAEVVPAGCGVALIVQLGQQRPGYS